MFERQFGEQERRQLADNPNTKVLSLWHLDLPDLAFLEPLTSLEDLKCYVLRVADYSALPRVKTLRTLFVSGPKESDFSYLGNMTQLRELSILWARQLTVLPDLSRCRKLERIQLYSCKHLADITSLTAIPNLTTVDILGLALKEPHEYEPLIASPQLRYIAVQLSGTRRNAELDRLLAKHGKSRYAPRT